MTCPEIRELLLEHLYGALDDAESAEVRRHLDACPSCRDALAAAGRQRDVLAAAARAEAGDVAFAAPCESADDAPRGSGRAPERPRRVHERRPLVPRSWWTGAAAAVLVGVAFAAGDALTARGRAADAIPVVSITGPSAVARGVPAEYRVSAHTLDGSAVPARFVATIDDGRGGETEVGSVDLAAGATEGVLAIDASEFAPGASKRMFLKVGADGRAPGFVQSFGLRETTRLLSRVSTDKPLYRPGETIRVRGVALESLRLTPAGNTDLRLRLLDPKGGVAADVDLPTLTGVTAWEHVIPEDAPGGTWKLVLSGTKDGTERTVAQSEREIQVRSYRAPRLRLEWEFDRTTYRPDDRGAAFLRVTRAEGGVPVGAEVTATVLVDHDPAGDSKTYFVHEDGAVRVPFDVRSDSEEGLYRMSVTVKDGGAVESLTRTIPVDSGILRTEWCPEGGSLVAGLPNRVYFRAKTPQGEPADLDCELRDAHGATVAAVKSEVQGLGAFEFTPVAGATYQVVRRDGTTLGDGNLLQAEAQGTTLRTLDDEVPAKGAVRVRVGSTSGGRHVVGVWCRGAQIGEGVVDVPRGGTADATVRLRSDVGGTLRVTVFDASNRPVAERLVARAAARKLDVAVTTSRPKAAPRERMSVSVRVRDEAGAASQAILGASVVDASVMTLADDRDTAPLPLHFLVGMEVDELEEAQAFTSGPGAPMAVDRLLGVQGWRRFAWRDPAEFAASHPDAGPRVAPVAANASPVRWSNEDAARAEVEWAVARSVRRSTGFAILIGALGLFVGCIVVAVRASREGRKLVATGAFAVPAVLLVGFVAAVTVPRMQEKRLVLADGAELEDAGDLSYAKSAEYDGSLSEEIGGLGDGVMDLLERAAEGAKVEEAKWAMAPGAAVPATAGSPTGAKGGQADLVEEETALDEGAERVAELEVLRRLGYLGGEDPRPGLFRFDDGDDATESGKKKRAARLVRVYAHRAAEWRGVRDDFAEVLAWNPLLVTDAQGEATFDFDTSDSITSFRVLVDAHDGRGALGTGAAEFSNRVPFFAEPKFPLALTAGDEVDLPVVVGNDADVALDVAARVRPDGALLGLRGAPGDVRLSVGAGQRGRAVVPLVALGGRGAASIGVEVSGGAGFLDRSRRAIDVHPRGFPIVVNRSGLLEKEASATFVLPDRVNRATFRGSLRIYPSTLATLVDGLDAMLQEPHGCFEQVSSTNYPNVLVLNYLEEQRAASPAVAARARDLLAKGYRMLSGYECRSRGFEWFGNDPAHEGLTAYGVLEFADMARVFDVDRDLVARSRDWLLGRRDGKGSFRRLADGYDGFARAPQDVHDAYVTWALSEADTGTDLAAELALLERRVDDGASPYVVALAANALRNRAHPAATRTLDRLVAMQRPDGGFDAKGTSITSSVERNLEIETTALAALAFARSPDRLANAEAAVRFLLANRNGGRFGATQATILALRALTEHAKASRRTATDHEISVLVNGAEVAGRSIRAGTPGVVEIGPEVVEALVPGENRVELRTTGAEALPWALVLDFTTDLPASDPACAVGIETSLASSEAREGASVEARVVVTNRTDAPQAMTIARVGVPGGLEPRAERLEELKKAGAIDFFELRPREVVLYWTALRPKAEKRVAFDLTAAVPGRYEGPASSAYLYYGDDRKTWSAPLRVTVR